MSDRHLDDAELVLRARAGDANAYATLMRRHYDAAFAVARRLTATVEDAEDACQEAFARAYFRLDLCGEAQRFAGWLMQIVRHQAHNVRRYQALRATVDDEVDGAAARDATDRSAEIAELRDQLRAALDRLSPIRRKVLLYHEVEGWGHAQIAHALGISTMMSRRHLSDARATLRPLLGPAARDFLNEPVPSE